MDREQIEREVRIIAADAICVAEGVLTDECLLADIADSLEIVDVFIEVQDHYNIYIPDEEAEKIITFKDLVDLTEEYINKQE